MLKSICLICALFVSMSFSIINTTDYRSTCIGVSISSSTIIGLVNGLQSSGLMSYAHITDDQMQIAVAKIKNLKNVQFSDYPSRFFGFTYSDGCGMSFTMTADAKITNGWLLPFTWSKTGDVSVNGRITVKPINDDTGNLLYYSIVLTPISYNSFNCAFWEYDPVCNIFNAYLDYNSQKVFGKDICLASLGDVFKNLDVNFHGVPIITGNSITNEVFVGFNFTKVINFVLPVYAEATEIIQTEYVVLSNGFHAPLGSNVSIKALASAPLSKKNIIDNKANDSLPGIKLDELLKSELVIKPNPFNPKTMIIFPSIHGNSSSLIIYDFNGKIVFTKNNIKTNHIEWNANNIPSGVYIVKIFSGFKCYSGKAILVR